MDDRLISAAGCYYRQRERLAGLRERIIELSDTVDWKGDLSPSQWCQLMSMALDFKPDLIIELGRGMGNSTCAFPEVAHALGGASKCTVLILCNSASWNERSKPMLEQIVEPEWFEPQVIERGNILSFDFAEAVKDAKRVLVFWDAHGFEVAECVLGRLVPLIADRPHAILMHDLSDARYKEGAKEGADEYGPHGLWKGNNWSGPRLRLGHIDSAVEQAIAVVDFTSRNRLQLMSADHSYHSELKPDPKRMIEMQESLGDLFQLQGHWFYFSLNEHDGPYTFPKLQGTVSTRAKSGHKAGDPGTSEETAFPYTPPPPTGQSIGFILKLKIAIGILLGRVPVDSLI